VKLVGDDIFVTNPAIVRQAIEKGVANARELTEMVTKANTEAFNVINKRVTEGLDEIRDFAKKRVAR
jgi:phasin family protein